MSQTTDEHTLWTLIKDIKFGMLTHRHSDGQLHSALRYNAAWDAWFVANKNPTAASVLAYLTHLGHGL